MQSINMHLHASYRVNTPLFCASDLSYFFHYINMHLYLMYFCKMLFGGFKMLESKPRIMNNALTIKFNLKIIKPALSFFFGLLQYQHFSPQTNYSKVISANSVSFIAPHHFLRYIKSAYYASFVNMANFKQVNKKHKVYFDLRKHF